MTGNRGRNEGEGSAMMNWQDWNATATETSDCKVVLALGAYTLLRERGQWKVWDGTCSVSFKSKKAAVAYMEAA